MCNILSNTDMLVTYRIKKRLRTISDKMMPVNIADKRLAFSVRKNSAGNFSTSTNRLVPAYTNNMYM